jgi:serine/threonine protein kinase
MTSGAGSHDNQTRLVHGAAPSGGSDPPRFESLYRAGEVMGPYKLISLLGEGGFGEVWLAERREPFVQRVALKFIKPGMDSKSVIARFEQERQALAVMNHPGIAKVLDGGIAPNGRPYFAMEYAKGEPISDFCDARKLSVKARLALFVQACEAVQHAHLKGIVHRDLKPANILAYDVAGEGPKLKVIDFGVAKAMSQSLTDKTIFTETGQMIGTPAYMSPEQADPTSSDIDTRSDIYSLGVVLYELITGTTPFDPKALRARPYADIQRIIRDEDPPSPSARLSTILTRETDLVTKIEKARGVALQELTRELRTELEWIPLKAMRKEPQNRYQSAMMLAEDVLAYLDGRPVTAAPESSMYRFRKYLRRNRARAIAASAAGVALLVGLAAAGWQWREAVHARGQLAVQLAETERAQRAEKERADALKQVSDFQSEILGQIDVTTVGSDLVLDLRKRFSEALVTAGVAEPDRLERIRAFQDELASLNSTDAAAAMVDRTILKPAIKTIERKFKDDPKTEATLRQAIGDLYSRIGLYDDAYGLLSSALETRRRLLGNEHPDTLSSVEQVAVVLFNQGKIAESEPLAREALAGRRRVLGEEHRDTLQSVGSMGALLQAQGKFDEASELLADAIATARRVGGSDDPLTIDLIAIMADQLLQADRLADAEPYLREWIERSRRVFGDDDPNTLVAIRTLSVLLQKQGKLEEAEPYFREALEGLRRTRGEEHPETLTAMHNMGFLLNLEGKQAEAEPYFREAIERSTRTRGAQHRMTLTYTANYAGMLLEQKRFLDAIDLLTPATAAARKSVADGGQAFLVRMLGMQSDARIALGFDAERFVRAEGDLNEAHALAARSRGEDSPQARRCADSLAALYTAWHAAQPGKGYDAKAALWAARGAAPSAPSAGAGAPPPNS